MLYLIQERRCTKTIYIYFIFSSFVKDWMMWDQCHFNSMYGGLGKIFLLIWIEFTSARVVLMYFIVVCVLGNGVLVIFIAYISLLWLFFLGGGWSLWYLLLGFFFVFNPRQVHFFIWGIKYFFLSFPGYVYV